MVFFQVRTIFLMIRGIDRTQALWQTQDKEMKKLIETQLRMQKAFNNLIFAGAAFMIFGTMIAAGFAKILESTSLGSLYMEDFRRVFEQLSISFGEAFLNNFRPMLDWLVQFLSALSQNAPLMDFMAKIAGFGLVFMLTVGPIMMMIGMIGSLYSNITLLLTAYGKWAEAHTIFSGVLSSSLAVIASVAGGLLLGYLAGQKMVEIFGGPSTMFAGLMIALAGVAGMLTYIALATSISTGGIAALAGVAAFGAAMAYVGYTSSDQTTILPENQTPLSQFSSQQYRGGGGKMGGYGYGANPTPPPSLTIMPTPTIQPAASNTNSNNNTTIDFGGTNINIGSIYDQATIDRLIKEYKEAQAASLAQAGYGQGAS